MTIHTLSLSFPELAQPELLADLAKNARWKDYREGQVVMDIGAEISAIPLLEKGSLRIIREDDSGRELLLYYLREGETCALSFTCCMVRQRSEVRAVAEEDSRICFIPLAKSEEWTNKYPEWKNLVMLTYRKRFQELLDTLDSLAFNSMDQRLLNWIQDRVDQYGNPIAKTHHEIAAELGTSREVISRLLKQLERQGKVVLGRNRVELVES
jgi:CRP/FNR family transcriptional regulator, anaerobic regulatory protein